MYIYNHTPANWRAIRTTNSIMPAIRRTGVRRRTQTPADIMAHAFSFDGDVVGGVINPFIPSCQASQALKHFPKMDIEMWHNFIRHTSTVLRGLKGSADMESIRRRARALANISIVDEVLQPIVLLDGHGRVLYSLIRSLYRRGIPFSEMAGKITVVDKSLGSHMWHQAFFPIGVECVEGDIIDHVKENPNTIVYFNFCGIGSMDTVQRLFELLPTRASRTTLLSFETTIRMAGHPDGPAQTLLKHILEIGWYESPDGRTDGFKTYIF